MEAGTEANARNTTVSWALTLHPNIALRRNQPTTQKESREEKIIHT
jgi:hypothetical protein